MNADVEVRCRAESVLVLAYAELRTIDDSYSSRFGRQSDDETLAIGVDPADRESAELETAWIVFARS